MFSASFGVFFAGYLLKNKSQGALPNQKAITASAEAAKGDPTAKLAEGDPIPADTRPLRERAIKLPTQSGPGNWKEFLAGLTLIGIPSSGYYTLFRTELISSRVSPVVYSRIKKSLVAIDITALVLLFVSSTFTTVPVWVYSLLFKPKSSAKGSDFLGFK